MKHRIDSHEKQVRAFRLGAYSFTSPRIHRAAIAILVCLLEPTVHAKVFKPSQVGMYEGNGTVRAVVAGIPKAPENARSRIRVRANSLGLDGVRFRFANGRVRGRYFELGLSMVLDGTYRKSSKRLIARGSLEIFSLEAAATVDATWAFRIFADGKRAQYVLAIRIPDPENTAIPVAIINARASGTRSP